jgi:hypothetical protein
MEVYRTQKKVFGQAPTPDSVGKRIRSVCSAQLVGKPR